MLISILMPVYNTALYLEECLQSILVQTEQDWELIAVDDFSTDNSFHILKKYAKQDTRIRFFKNTAKGIIPALRLAYEKSRGDLITRMDSDDVMMPTKLTCLKNLLLENGKGVLATGLVKYFSATGLKDGYRKYETWLNELTKSASNFSEIYKECVIPSPCWMLWREDLESCGAFHSNTYPEDYDLCFRFYKNKLKVLGAKEVLHQWRDYETRTSRTDATYSNNQYLDLKLPYFLELEYVEARPLVLWGAGKKGKRLARMLVEKEVSFHWVCNSENKWGLDIFGVKLESFQTISQLEHPQIIVAVAAPSGQKEILEFLNQNGFHAQKHYWFFA